MDINERPDNSGQNPQSVLWALISLGVFVGVLILYGIYI